jgi:Rieske Fe-S protein
LSDVTRRDLIRGAAALTCLPLAGAGCARRIDTNRSLAVPEAVDGDVRIPLAAAPELERAGGAVVVHPAGEAGAYLVVSTGAGHLAMRAECPHQGCLVAWVAEDRQAECPCHGSRFAGDGTVLNPPARTGLETYPATLDGQGNLVVHLYAGDGVFKERVQDGQVRFAIADYPVLLQVRGVILGRPEGFPTPLLVTRVAAGSGADAILALAAICTHLGCTVQPSAGLLQCPCHGSQFDLEGHVLHGPALDSLIRYVVASFDGATVTVSTQFRT